MIRHTVCRLCSACCPVEVEVQQDKLIKGERKSFLPPQERLVCPKIRSVSDIVYSKQRILKPLVRANTAENFRETSWDEALDIICKKFEHTKASTGPQGVAWLRGMGADWGTPWDYANRFMNAFGSPNTIGNGSVCHVAREIAHFFTYGAMTLPMPKDSKCIVLWGKNDKNTAPQTAEAILFAQKRGAKLIVIDPIKTFFAKRADIWLPIKPGHDGLLAMAMINEIIRQKLYDKSFVESYTIGFEKLKEAASLYPAEEIGPTIWLNSEIIKEACRLYANTKPACIIDGNGLDMHLEVFQTTRAVSILRALTGNIDVPGGDFIPQPVPARPMHLKELIPPSLKPITKKYKIFNDFHPTWGLHSQSCLIDAIVDEDPYPVRMLFVQSGNPAVTMTEAQRVAKAFEKLDFLVVIDLFHTRTTRYAHVILPATTCFEKTQINRAYIRNSFMMLQDQVIPWLGDSKPDWKIIFDLAQKAGLEKYFPWKSVEEAIDYQFEPANITVEKLRAHPEGLFVEPLRYEKYKSSGFPTTSGKVEFYSEKLNLEGFDPVPYKSGFPKDPISFSNPSTENMFIGMSGERTNCYTHTQFHQVEKLRYLDQEPFVEINPSDGAKLDISDGDLVSVSTPKGNVIMKARKTDLVPQRVVRIPWGWGEVNPLWNVNNLTDDSLRNPITCTPSNRSFYCEVRKVT